jgi:hypothetical protein
VSLQAEQDAQAAAAAGWRARHLPGAVRGCQNEVPMTPRNDLAERSAPLLPQGSEIRQVFICQAAPNFSYFILTYLTGLTTHSIKYRCVAVTKDAIYVLESSKLSGGARPQSLVGTMPRHTQFGPVSGRWAEITILGERHWVHKRFHPCIADADREAGFMWEQVS